MKKHLKLSLFFFLLLNFSSLDLLNYKNIYLHGELSLLEFSQTLLILFSIGILLKNKKTFLIYLDKKIFWIKFLFLSFILYEELSWVTTDLSKLFIIINSQNEINIHNLDFLYQKTTIINSIGLFIVGFGSYFPFLKNVKFLFLEKKYAPYTFAYSLPLIINLLSLYLFNKSLLLNLNQEFFELFFYTILYLDLNEKKNFFLNIKYKK